MPLTPLLSVLCLAKPATHRTGRRCGEQGGRLVGPGLEDPRWISRWGVVRVGGGVCRGRLSKGGAHEVGEGGQRTNPTGVAGKYAAGSGLAELRFGRASEQPTLFDVAETDFAVPRAGPVSGPDALGTAISVSATSNIFGRKDAHANRNYARPHPAICSGDAPSHVGARSRRPARYEAARSLHRPLERARPGSRRPNLAHAHKENSKQRTVICDVSRHLLWKQWPTCRRICTHTHTHTRASLNPKQTERSRSTPETSDSSTQPK